MVKKHKVRIVIEGGHDIVLCKKLSQGEFGDKNFISMNGKGNLLNFDDSNYETLKNEIKNLSINKILFILDADCEKENNMNDGYDNTKERLENHIIEFRDNIENSKNLVSKPKCN